MNKLIYLNIIASLMYVGCSGLSVKAPLPAKVSSAPPTAELFPVQKHYYNSPSKYGPHLKGKLAGHADDFANASRKYKVPINLLIAVSSWETGFGSSSAIKTRKNAFGSMMKTKRGYKLRSFPSIAASINFTAKSLRDNYFAKNRRTVSQISFKYCPQGREKWVKGVNSIMRKLP